MNNPHIQQALDLCFCCLFSFFGHLAGLLLDQGVFFVDVEGVLVERHVDSSEVLYSTCKDITVFLQEFNEIAFDLAVQEC